MKKIIYSLSLAFVLLTIGAISSAFYYKTEQTAAAFRFPYKQAGLADREAAAHLISRFTFGAKPGQVDEVLQTGLEKWFVAQLNASFEDKTLSEKLASYESLKMTNEEIAKTYPKGGELLRMAIKDGVIDKDSARVDKKDYKQKGFPENPIDYLKRLNIQNIFRFVITHPDMDHLDGIKDFFSSHHLIPHNTP